VLTAIKKFYYKSFTDFIIFQDFSKKNLFIKKEPKIGFLILLFLKLKNMVKL